MKKVLFRLSLQSLSDVITNSSSELFVFKNRNMEAVKLTLDTLHPDWRDEYSEPEWVRDMNKDTFKEYISEVLGNEQYHCTSVLMGDWRTTEQKSKDWLNGERDNDYYNCYLSIAKQINEEPSKLYANWDTFNPYDWDNWENRQIEFTDFGLTKFQEIMGDEIALWSLDDNPNWDYQVLLMDVAKRYHLG